MPVVSLPLTVPLSAIAREKVLPFTSSSASVPAAATVTELVLLIEPVVPLPICSVLPLTVVAPVYVFAAVRVAVSELSLVRPKLPVELMTLLKASVPDWALTLGLPMKELAVSEIKPE